MKRNTELLDKAEGFNIEVIKSYEIGKDYTYLYSELKDGLGYLEVQHSRSKEKILKVIFDGYKMIWYGSYGVFAFDCTWKTDLKSIPFENPYYLVEKISRGIKAKVFEGTYTKKLISRYIKEGTWFEYDLDENQRKDLMSWLESGANSYNRPESIESDYEDLLDIVEKLYSASGDEYEWVEAIRSLGEDEGYDLFGVEPYHMFDWGVVVYSSFFFLLYILSLVAEDYYKNL